MIVRWLLYITALVFLSCTIVFRIADMEFKVASSAAFYLLLGGAFVGATVCIKQQRLIKYILFLYGASFPFYINHSWRVHTAIFEFFTAMLAVALLLTTIKNNSFRNRLNPVVAWFFFLFAAICCLSLQLLPEQNFFQLMRRSFMSSAITVFNALPYDPLYSVAAVWRLLLFMAFVSALSLREDYDKCYRFVFIGALCGGLWASLVGLLEYFNMISLLWFRQQLDLRLQSVTGNPGWFAEYLTMTIPYILFGFISKRGWKLKALLFGVMMLFEIAIILTGARSGWLAYPVTLFFCWLFFYLSKDAAEDEKLHKKFRLATRVALSIPLTIAVSLFLVVVVFDKFQKNIEAELTIHSQDSQLSRDLRMHTIRQNELKNRYATLFMPVERIAIAQEALALWQERPMFGLGWESYRVHTGIMEQIPESLFSKNRYTDKLFDTPHNFYLQLLIGVGLAGCVLWLLLAAYGFIVGMSGYFRSGITAAIPVLLALYSFHQYGLTQDPPYISTVWMLVFLNIGYLMALPVVAVPARVQKISLWLARSCCVLVVCAGVAYAEARSSKDFAAKYGYANYGREQSDDTVYEGFYKKEQDKQGDIRWSGKNSIMRFEGDGLYRIDYLVPTRYIEQGAQRINFSLDGTIVARDTCRQAGWKTRYFYASGNPREHELEIIASGTWSPGSSNSQIQDTRQLSIAVRTPLAAVDLSNRGWVAGLYWKEPASEAIPGWPEGVDTVFRWMNGVSCALELPPEVISIYIRNGHPNSKNFQLRAHVSLNGKKPLVVFFKTGKWVECAVGGVGSEGRLVTINIDRTWNGRRVVQREPDPRELGLMVAVPFMEYR
ncbi:MAG: O-antigen ligase family protein [Deltaproteobacteria bacterium]|nr:O-antigen ligase family protein [Deltaproteobacteria bacterium]